MERKKAIVRQTTFGPLSYDIYVDLGPGRGVPRATQLLGPGSGKAPISAPPNTYSRRRGA